ncbi:uncharacterized protein [Argopecten irradians]|uniref:uncharacterized protein n=1 Tax=Argopecten irradians TaxID=31199 RepID=UPI00371C3686
MAAHIENMSDRNVVYDKIRAFKQSEEERLVKICLMHIVQNDAPFINLVIDSCNAKRACAFSEACVELKPYIEEVGITDTEDIGLIHMKYLFKLVIINGFLEDGVDYILYDEDIDIAKSFLSLLEFLHARRSHGTAIEKIMKEASGKLNVIAALTQHLFSQLIPGKQCIIDDTEKQLPGNSNVEISVGNTSIGSFSTWHGKADILVNNMVAVTVFEENKNNNFRNFSHNMVSKNISNDADIRSPDTTTSEPSTKKRKVTSSDNSEVLLEMGGGNGNVLTDLRTLDQLVSETVTNAFTQVNMDDGLTGLFIPTIGCTAEHASVFLYDPVNDILLQSGELLQLWHVTPSETLISVFSTVVLWLFLNFETFGVEDLHDKVKLDKSRFHEYMKNKLRFYKEIQIGMPSNNLISSKPVGTLTQDLKMYCKLRKPNE